MNCKSISGEKRDCQVTAYGTSVDASNKSVEIKIYIRKSNKKPLYAEATEDFVDLLCSFLTFPLSNVVSLLSGDSSFGCVDNLYKSVQGLDDKWFVSEGELDKDHLVKTAPKFSCSIADFIFGQVKVRQEVRLVKNKSGSIRGVNFGYYLSPGDVLLKLTSPAPKWGCVVHSFLKKPAMFLVSDSLVIKSCDKTTTNISFLKGLDVPIDDIEEHTIKIAKEQVLGILKASLTTNSAFSSLIGLLPKKPKPESF